MKTAEKLAIEKILFIDTSTNNSMVAVLNSDKVLDKVVWNGSGELSDSLLIKIEELLKKLNINLPDISSIAVNLGPGSYTGLRIGVSTANAISWSRKIPIRSAKFEGGKIKFLTPQSLNPIFPDYLRPPNITKSKKI
jgi:tRNA A37 threonylcarbamoyltransferase TsaD